MPGSDPTTTTLYRLFGREGDLLYVGIAADWPKRMRQHARDKAWWPEVANVATQQFPTRAAAEAAEQNAIRSENPKHNIVYRSRAPRQEERPTSIVVQGRIVDLNRRGDRLALRVDPCPLCGGRHTHGWLTGEAERGIAFRAPHCFPFPDPPVWQRIVFTASPTDVEALRGSYCDAPPRYRIDDLPRWELEQRRIHNIPSPSPARAAKRQRPAFRRRPTAFDHSPIRAKDPEAFDQLCDALSHFLNAQGAAMDWPDLAEFLIDRAKVASLGDTACDCRGADEFNWPLAAQQWTDTGGRNIGYVCRACGEVYAIGGWTFEDAL